MQQRQAALIELLEPIVPLNLLQFVFAGVSGKIQPQNPDVPFISGTAHA